MKTARFLTISAALLLSQGVTHAIPILFDLEEQPQTPFHSGFFTSLSMTKMGFTMTITRPSDHPETSAFDIVDFSALEGRPATWGTRTLEPSNFEVIGGWDNTNFFLVDFSAPITSFSAEFGDAKDTDDDSPVTMEAWSRPGGSGATIDTASQDYPIGEGIPRVGGPPAIPGSISVSGEGIQSIIFRSGGGAPNTLYWDNFRVTPVPDSSTTVILLGMSLLTLGLFKQAGKKAR